MLTQEQKECVAEYIDVKSYSKGEVVVPDQIKCNSALWIVLKGSISGSELSFSRFDIAGDEYVNTSNSEEVYSGEIIATESSDIGFITNDKVENILGGNVTSVAEHNVILHALGQITLFATLSNSKLRDLANSLRIEEFDQGDHIIKQGDKGTEFYIVKEGTVDIRHEGNVVRSLSKLMCFGERSLITDEIRSANAVATEPNTQCWVMRQEDFRQVMDENIIAHLTQRMELQDNTVQLSDLSIIKTLGCGTFGSVYLCVNNAKNTLYALKSVPRTKIDKYGMHSNIKYERNLLLKLDHSMIMKLVKTFKDEHRIYFLMEYIHGIDLFDAIREINILDNSQARFYVGCLTLALEHLAEKTIVHRDLKPENVMVDVNGYAKLIDFGTAKLIKNRTYTVVGTPHYMAPEVIKGKGYSISVDLWSLGIMLYEFIACELPFGEGFEDSYAVYEAILRSPLKFTNMIQPNHPARHVIQRLVNRDPINRGTPTNLKKDPWFKDMDWDALTYHTVKPNFTPIITAIDTKRVMKGSTHEIMLRDEAQDPVFSSEDSAVPRGWDTEF